MGKIVVSVISLIVLAIMIHLVNRHYSVKNFRKTCKPFDACHIWCAEDYCYCYGMILSVDRTAGVVTVCLRYPDVYGYAAAETRRMSDLYP